MSRHETNAADATMDIAFDKLLSEHFESQAEPEDDGFSRAVMATLPARAARPRIRWVRWVERAQWAAISLAACGVAGLMSMGEGRVDPIHQAAAYALIGLLVFWSIPSRWSRG